ncbi:MAG: hypothetical protein EHM72_21200, partial [Calditrichaeota bacterium]
DLSSSDDEFRDELMSMLALSESEGTETATFTTEGEPAEEMASTEATSSEQDELLAMLTELDESNTGDTFQAEEDLAETITPTGEFDNNKTLGESYAPLADDSERSTLISQVRELESILEKRSVQVDSLRRIIDNRNARIAELQNRTTMLAEVEPVAIQKTVQRAPEISLTGLSGPFVEKYNQGRLAFESYSYDGCISIMSELLGSEPSHILTDNAQYWIGESYYGLKQYQKAVLEFQKVFAYETTDKYDDAQLMIGLCQVRLNQPEVARSTFKDFLNTYMGSEYAGIAKRYYENI